MKDHINEEKEQCVDIGLRGFDNKLFEEEEGGGTREGLDWYPYLKHLMIMSYVRTGTQKSHL